MFHPVYPRWREIWTGRQRPRFGEKGGVFYCILEGRGEDFIRIRIKHHDKNNDNMQLLDIIMYTSDESIFLLASYTDNIAAFGFLYGSI